MIARVKALGSIPVMRLDHISYACTSSELVDVVQRIGSDLGATFRDGGRHPQFGTRNFVLPLAGGSYIEVVSALDHPAAEKAPFGRAVSRRAADGGGWLGWVIAIDDISVIEARLGREAVSAHRIRPDGLRLNWRQIGVLDQMEDAQLPFFVEWDVDSTDHPSFGGSPVRIERIEMSGSSETIAGWLQSPIDQPLDEVDVTWVEADEPGVVAVWFATPNGSVRVD